MKCDEPDCHEMAMTSIRKDLFGKSDAMRNLCSKHAPHYSIIGSTKAAPMPTVADLRSAHERFREVMTDTLERATAFLRDRHADGVTDEDDDALLRECETTLEWAKQCSQADGEGKP